MYEGECVNTANEESVVDKHRATGVIWQDILQGKYCINVYPSVL